MRISKKKQAIIDAFETQKEKDDYINQLKMEYLEKDRENSRKYRKENLEKAREISRKSARKYYAKKEAEKQLIDGVIDGRKLAIELKQEKAYEWLINDNNGSYSEDKHQLGIVLVNNLQFMSDDCNNAEYGTYEAWTKENIDAVCKMLDAMFEFCNKRQIKYINLN